MNHYEIKKSKRLDEWARNIKPSGEFKGVSLVVIGLLRFNENTKLNFRANTMDGMTWPLEVRKAGRSLLAKTSKLHLDLFLAFKLTKIEELINNNEHIILLYRTSAWKEDGNFLKDSWHYIVLKKVVPLSENRIQITYWDYGFIKITEISLVQYYSSVVKLFVFYK